MEAKVTLEYVDSKTAKAITQAISPENFKTPIGLTAKTIRKNNKVITRIQCAAKIATFTATIDDLLFSVSTAEKALKAIKRL